MKKEKSEKLQTKGLADDFIQTDDSPCGPRCDFCGTPLEGHQCPACGNLMSCGD